MEDIKEIKKKNKVNNLIAFLALSLLLVALPAGSWYYLQKGLNYQKDARKELKDYGKVSDFSFLSSDAERISLNDLKGNFTVATFLGSGNAELQQEYLQIIDKLHEQFDLRPDVLFLTHLSGLGEEDSSVLLQINDYPGLQDEEQVLFLRGDPATMEEQAREGYRLPLGDMAFADNSYLALVDSTGTVINYYNFREEAEVRRLVEHIAMVIPKKIPAKPKVKRELEK